MLARDEGPERVKESVGKEYESESKSIELRNVAFIAPREDSRDALDFLTPQTVRCGSLCDRSPPDWDSRAAYTRLSSRGAMKATFFDSYSDPQIFNSHFWPQN